MAEVYVYQSLPNILQIKKYYSLPSCNNYDDDSFWEDEQQNANRKSFQFRFSYTSQTHQRIFCSMDSCFCYMQNSLRTHWAQQTSAQALSVVFLLSRPLHCSLQDLLHHFSSFSYSTLSAVWLEPLFSIGALFHSHSLQWQLILLYYHHPSDQVHSICAKVALCTMFDLLYLHLWAFIVHFEGLAFHHHRHLLDQLPL